MRHNNKINKLGRSATHRKALLNNLSESLFINGYIRTTLAKAKVLRPYVEKIITSAKKVNEESFIPNRLIHIRNILRNIKQKEAYNSLLRVWGPLCMDRHGGYTRILKLGTRLGDAAEMAIIGIVIDQNLLKRYNIQNFGYKNAYIYLSNYLIQNIPQPKLLLHLWTFSKMPNIKVLSSYLSDKEILNFSIQFDQINDLNVENWPIFNGEYPKLPLTISVEIKRKSEIPIKRNRRKKKATLLYAENKLIDIKAKENLIEIPLFTQHNILRVLYSPNKSNQIIEGSIEGKYSNLNSCEIIITGPAGRIFYQNII